MLGKRGIMMSQLGKFIIILAGALVVIAVVIMFAKGSISGGIGKSIIEIFQ